MRRNAISFAERVEKVGSPIPILAALPLHSDAGRIADLNPDCARTGLIGAIDPLGDNALGAEPASVRKDGGAILFNVSVEQNARLGIAQQPRERSLAVEERAIAQILAVVLDQIEGVENGSARGHRSAQVIES
jgi:hypothetical protein